MIFRQYGFGKGDGIHMVLGNRNHSFLALFGALLLGGFGSCGDIALDAPAIAGNLCRRRNQVKYKNCIFCTKGNII